MSGVTVTRALQDRFDAIRRAELERLEKKLRGLNAEDRRSVEAITADVIRAIAGVPVRALACDTPESAWDALVRLFCLSHPAVPSSQRQ